MEADGRITLINLLEGITINSFYFNDPEASRKAEESSSDQTQKMRINDVCLSEDERELSCVGANYLVIYSM